MKIDVNATVPGEVRNMSAAARERIDQPNTSTSARSQSIINGRNPGAFVPKLQSFGGLLLTLSFALVGNSAWAISVSLTAPANGAVFQAPATIALTATATPTNSSRPIVKVEFFRGATLIGTDTTSPYSFTWTNAPAGTYSLTAKATDSTGATATSGARSIKVNAAPAVSLTAPAANAVFTPGATIALTAVASDSDGTISKVEFFRDTTLLRSDTTAPYSFNWTAVPAGSYTLTARATDNNGAITISAPVNISVNTLPVVSITSPVDGALFLALANVTVTASATVANNPVAKVEFFDGTALVGSVSAAPYSVTLINLSLGTHTLTARATDSLGVTTTSTVVSIRVNAPPTVSITTPPASDIAVTLPADVFINATAADPDGTVTKVEFFDGASLFGAPTSPPYSIFLSNPAPGLHSITARATDNDGAITVSSVLRVTAITAAVSLSISAPLSGASLDENITLVTGSYFGPFNAGIAVNGQAACTDGQQFFVNNLPLAVGSNTITATGTIMSGAKATQSIGVSSAGPFKINISVTPPCGAITPLTAKFSLANNSGKPIATIQADYDGDGTWDVVTSDPKATLQFVYTLAGTYRAHFRITDSQGTAYDNTVLVLVSSQSGMNATHQTIWQGVTSNLAVGNIELALTYFAPEIRDRYRTVLNNIASALPGMFSNFPPISPTRISGDDAEYFVVLPQGGVDYGFYIYFGRGSDGIWRVQGL